MSHRVFVYIRFLLPNRNKITAFVYFLVLKLLEVTYLILQKPNLTQSEEYKTCSIVMQYFDSSLECYGSDKCPEIIKLICSCIQSILCVHKEFKLLESFSAFLKSLPEGIRSIFSEHLSKIIVDLHSGVKEDKTASKKYVIKELQKVIAVLECEPEKDDKKTFVAPSGRSARIAQLAKKTPKSPKKQGTASIALRLFGKDPETLSPLKVKGSQLNNTPSPRKKKAANIIQKQIKIPTPVLEENSSDFVAINTEIKFEPEKLSEHQKEVFKKRRDDIPALYEDLSQSLSSSQDLFSSKFNTNSSDNQKVVVQQIITFTPKRIVENIVLKEDKSNEVRHSQRSEDLFSSEGNFDAGTAMEIETKQEADNIQSSDIIDGTADQKEVAKSGDLFDSPSTGKKKVLVDEKRKKKIEKELQKLKMDVVGADNYVSVARRTRPKEKKENEEKDKKPKGRKSMVPTEKHSKDDPNRRKSIGIVDELKSKNDTESKDSNKISDEVTIKKENSSVPNKKSKEMTIVSNSQNNNQEKEQETDVLKTTAKKTDEDEKDSVKEGGVTIKMDKTKDIGQIQAEKTINNSKKENEISKSKKVKDISTDRNSISKVTASEITSTDKIDETTNEKRGNTKVYSMLIADTFMKQTSDVLTSNKTENTPTSTGLKISEEDMACSKVKEVNETNSIEDTHDVTEIDKPSVSQLKSPVKSNKRTIPIVETPKTTRRISMNAEKNKQIVVDQEISTNETKKEIDSEIEIKPRKPGKRKNKVEVESEDIIESSQESFADVTPLLNSSKKRKLSVCLENTFVSVPKNPINDSESVLKPSDENHTTEGNKEIPVETENISDTTQDTTLSRETSLDTTQTQDSLNDISLSSSKNSKIENDDQHLTMTQDTLTQITQETPSQVDLDMLSEIGKPTVLYLDLPKKPQLTESEQMMCRMDTMSICSNLEEFRSDKTSSHHQSLEEVELQARSPTKCDTEHDDLGE